MKRPFLGLASVGVGIYLLWYGISHFVASQYVKTGDSYTSMFGSMLAGLVLTLGPQVKAAGMAVLDMVLRQLNILPNVTPQPNVNPAPNPTPSPNNQPVLPAFMISSPEASFLAVLALARFARTSGNTSVLGSLKVVATALFDMCFEIKETPNVTPSTATPLPDTAL